MTLRKRCELAARATVEGRECDSAACRGDWPPSNWCAACRAQMLVLADVIEEEAKRFAGLALRRMLRSEYLDGVNLPADLAETMEGAINVVVEIAVLEADDDKEEP